MSGTQSSLPTEPVLFQSASEWLELLKTRRIGAVELLKLHLAQVERHNPSVNAVIATDIEGAMSAALAADNTAVPAQGPLHGLPMTIKDTYEVVGMPATCGFPFLAGHMPNQDADPVARLKSAGAIIYGKTNVPPGAFDWQSTNPIYGTTNNPWNLGRSPGGSSGGAAAAVAAGFTPLEIGSDMGGSVRVPAHFCGVYGHKPSYGIIPMRGHIPPLPGPGQDLQFEMGVGGPLARSAKDLELALDILVDADPLERHAWKVTIPASRHERLQDFRVALWADEQAFPVDANCISAINSWSDDLRRLGVKVDLNARPDINWKESYDTYLSTVLQLMGAGTPPEAVQHMIDAGERAQSDGYMARLANALKLRHYEYFNVMLRRKQLIRSWREFFTRYDLLICPAYGTVAYPHDHRGNDLGDPISMGEVRSQTINGRAYPYFDGLQWPAVATVADLPATALPTGLRVEGMPLGVQVIGPYLEDRTPLRFAQLVEQALGGFTPPPAVV